MDRVVTSYRKISVSPNPAMVNPSPEAATEAATIWVGKVPTGCGNVLAATPAMVDSSVVVPDTGSSNRKSVDVTTSAMPSMPKATPNGGLPNAKVCWLLLVRSMIVSALDDEAGGAA